MITNLALGVNVTTLGFITIMIFVLYILGTIIRNAYINFTPKATGRFFVFVYMLGILTVAIVVGSVIFIVFSFVVGVVFITWAILKGRRDRKKKERAAATSQFGGSGTNNKS